MPGEDEKQQPRMTLDEMKTALREDEQQKKLFENVEALGKKIDQVQKQQGLFCDPHSGMCFLTRAEFERFMKEQNAKIPRILGGYQDLSGLFRSLVKEGNEKGQDEAVQARIPPELKARWVKEWCRDGQCKALLEAEGFEINDDEIHKGAFPGS